MIITPGQSGVSKTSMRIEKTEASGSEGGCAYEFASRGHTVCSPTNSESSHGKVGITKSERPTYNPVAVATIMRSS